MIDFEIEKEYAKKGFQVICGIDEAGRGPLAGPVCAAAVILPLGTEIAGLNDSKKLTEKKREVLFPIIIENAVAYGIGFASEKEIDKINILNATFLAMRRAVEAMETTPDLLLIDGNQRPKIGIGTEVTVVKGDMKSVSIAAASVLAKVSRDRYMLEKAREYPQYAFEKHKGYGTKLHYERIAEFGVAPIHRRSFLKKILGDTDV